jgi:hypothetical protein
LQHGSSSRCYATRRQSDIFLVPYECDCPDRGTPVAVFQSGRIVDILPLATVRYVRGDSACDRRRARFHRHRALSPRGELPGSSPDLPAANLYLEGTLTEFYPDLTRDRAGLTRLIRGFSWPGGFPSHLSPGTPGAIHEGGELGYALATAFGAALDNPDLLVACIVGDGEAETGPTATAWHGVKYLDPVTCGAVLPILNLNSYKISSPSIFGTMAMPELEALFRGYGYDPIVVAGPNEDASMAAGLEQAYARIRAIQEQARAGGLRTHPCWPMLIVITPKGWTGIKELDGKPIEGSFRSHQVPVEDVRENPEHLALLEGWLRSYHPEEWRCTPRVFASRSARWRRRWAGSTRSPLPTAWAKTARRCARRSWRRWRGWASHWTMQPTRRRSRMPMSRGQMPVCGCWSSTRARR